jgi:hypothetical protein
VNRVEQELYTVEQALEKILEFFEPSTDSNGYVVWEDGEPLARVEGELADAIAHANEVLYGDPIEDDD